MSAALLCLFVSTPVAAEVIYPVKLSENHRYFVNQSATPVFWLGTTQWQLFRDNKLEDARTILEKTKERGFEQPPNRKIVARSWSGRDFSDRDDRTLDVEAIAGENAERDECLP